MWRRWVRSCVFSPDGRTIATAGDDGTVRLWREGRTSPIAEMTGHEGWALSCAFSPDGRTIASAGEDGTVRLWRKSGGEPIAVMNRLALQAILSQRMDARFAAAPRILNELINRDHPSSSAASGRNKLCAAMLAHPHEEDLGMTGFPAEKGIYRA